jgi:hypothetical protein
VSWAWYFGDLADHLARAMAELEAGVGIEQAPHGLDVWGEARLQQALAAALARDHEVAREVHYPSTAGRKRSHRARCDLVLAPAGQPLSRGEPLPGLCPPERALWLELKVARQRRPDGARDGRYGAQWRRHLVADLRKMAAEPRIHDAGLVLVAFTEDEAALHRDLDGFESVLTSHGVVAGFRHVRTVAISDRIGHRTCGVALWPTLQGAP